MTKKSNLTTEADAVLFKFRMYGGDCGIYILEDLDMTVKVFTRVLNSLLAQGYLEKTHDRLPGLWFQLTRKGLLHVRKYYPRLPDSNDLDKHPYLRQFSRGSCHQPYAE